MATLIEGRSSYETVLCLGHILDAEGQKMSKSRGNVVQPDDVLDRQGADAFRWYLFTTSSPWYPRRFSVELVDEVVRKFLLTLWNTYSFFTVYANIDRFDPAVEPVPLAERPLLDRWLAGRLAAARRDKSPTALEDYDAASSGRAIQEFVDELSNWYVRRSRRRFWKSGSDADKLAAYHTLHECLVTLAKLLAPYTPFVAEELYQNLVRSVDSGAPESVHLCDWPVADEDAVDEAVTFDMDTARRVVELGRAARNAAAVKTRQPLAEVAVAAAAAERAALERLRDIVTDELNVKELRFVVDAGELLDYSLKPNLKLLGPRLGRQVGAVGAALREVDAPEFVAALRTGGSAPLVLADGEQVRLAEDEVLVETVAPDGCRVESDGAFTVALRTTVDRALRDEGIVRELVHAVQLYAQKRRFTHRGYDQPGAVGAGRAGRARRAQRGVHQERDLGKRARARRPAPIVPRDRAGRRARRDRGHHAHGHDLHGQLRLRGGPRRERRSDTHPGRPLARAGPRAGHARASATASSTSAPRSGPRPSRWPARWPASSRSTTAPTRSTRPCA